MANKKDLANGLIGTALTSAATTLVLQAGYGNSMPAVPFFLTITPAGQLSTRGNSEIVRVTARNGDTLTIERAQKGTAARAFSIGDVVSNSIYTDEKWTSDNIDWATFAQLAIDNTTTSNHATNRTTKTASTNETPVYQAQTKTITNSTGKRVTVNFTLAAMGQKTSGGNTQIWQEFNGARVSPTLYFDVLNTWLAFATTFSYTFEPGQSVTTRIAVGGDASGGLADNNTVDLGNGWPPRLVGAVAFVEDV